MEDPCRDRLSRHEQGEEDVVGPARMRPANRTTIRWRDPCTEVLSWAGMCGRYTNTAGPEELNERFRVPISGDAGTRRFNIAPTEQVLAIVAPDGEQEARLLRWGLVPSWATSIDGPLMINARMESVTSKPAYRRLIPRAERRALQLADGYFEWLKPEKRSEPRQPFYFQVDGGTPFAFAALWTPAKVDGSGYTA